MTVIIKKQEELEALIKDGNINKEEAILDNFEKVFNETEKFTEALGKAFGTIPAGYLHDKS